MAKASSTSAARPKSSRVERPYSISKDEAYARMLQEEEYCTTLDEDEAYARQLQQELNLEEQAKMREAMSVNRPPRRAMTPITQLFSQLVSASLGQNSRRHLQREETQCSEVDGTENSSDSDSSESDIPGASGTTPRRDSDTSTTSPRTSSIKKSPTAGKTVSGAPKSSRNRGIRPTETSITASERATERPTVSGRGRGTTNIRGNRRGRGTGVGRGGAGSQRSSQGRGNKTSTTDNETGENRPTPRRTTPATMEPSPPPLSLAVSGQELPEGETEPEIMILDRGSSDTDTTFIHIMRDPMLLLLFLMGRVPEMLVPDDVDPNDYEALWELAEQLGEVKNRGLSDKELHTLPSKLYYNKTKLSGNEGPECRVCLYTYKAGESISTLPCKHEFHEKCIKEWLKRNASCPICRHEIRPSKQTPG